MRIIAILALAVGAIWAAKTGKLKKSTFKKSKLDDLRGRAMDLASSATDDLGQRADDVADRVRSATH
jgi:hypothetical protein